MFSVSGTDIEITRGDTGILDVSPSNYSFVSGDVAYLTVKLNKADTTPIFQKVVTSFTDNVAKFIFSTSDTTQTPGKYWYDIQFTLSDGRVDTVIEPSRFIIKGDIT